MRHFCPQLKKADWHVHTCNALIALLVGENSKARSLLRSLGEMCRFHQQEKLQMPLTIPLIIQSPTQSIFHSGPGLARV
jgi:hypothetical protein